jgi:hypothetical protein
VYSVYPSHLKLLLRVHPTEHIPSVKLLTCEPMLLQVGPCSYKWGPSLSPSSPIVPKSNRSCTLDSTAATPSVHSPPPSSSLLAASSTPCCRPGHRCWRADLWRAQLAAASRLHLRCACIQISTVALAHAVGRVARRWQLDLWRGLPFLLHMRLIGSRGAGQCYVAAATALATGSPVWPSFSPAQRVRPTGSRGVGE